MKNCLITGGAGFIGSNFVRFCCERSQAKLIVVDALTYAGNLANIADLIDDEQVKFVKGDIGDSTLINGLLTEFNIDTIVHFAAESHVDRSIEGPGDFIRTNIHGTYKLLDAARITWGDHLDDKVFLHVSTDEVFGSLGPNDPAFDEHTPYRPNSPYAASKAASDHLVRAWHHTYGLPVLIGNCSNNYGPWQFPEKLIPLMILNTIEKRELPVYGDGQQIRDWLHVEDHCNALLTIVERGRPGQTYCIGGDNECANIDVVNIICDSVDQALERPDGYSRSLIRHVEDRLGHDRRYAVNNSKLRAELGWNPSRSLQSELPNLIQWYLAQRAWADNIRSGEYQAFYDRNYDQQYRR